MVTLEATRLGHRFGRNVLFRGLSLRMVGGDAVAITGPNGSGKSTLLHILAGLLRPSAGEVILEVDGQLIEREEQPFRCALVAPYLNVYEGFSVRENLRFIARTRGIGDAESRIAAAIDDVGLDRRADDFVATFSSGMKQRVKFAIAALVEPAVLLLDEPSTNLDAPGRAMVERMMQRQVERDGILLLATNDADEAARCDRRLSIEAFQPVSSLQDPRQPR